MHPGLRIGNHAARRDDPLCQNIESVKRQRGGKKIIAQLLQDLAASAPDVHDNRCGGKVERLQRGASLRRDRSIALIIPVASPARPPGRILPPVCPPNLLVLGLETFRPHRSQATRTATAATGTAR